MSVVSLGRHSIKQEYKAGGTFLIALQSAKIFAHMAKSPAKPYLYTLCSVGASSLGHNFK